MAIAATAFGPPSRAATAARLRGYGPAFRQPLQPRSISSPNPVAPARTATGLARLAGAGPALAGLDAALRGVSGGVELARGNTARGALDLLGAGGQALSAFAPRTGTLSSVGIGSAASGIGTTPLRTVGAGIGGLANVGFGALDLAEGRPVPGGIGVGSGLLSLAMLTNPVTAPFAWIPAVGGGFASGLSRFLPSLTSNRPFTPASVRSEQAGTTGGKALEATLGRATTPEQVLGALLGQWAPHREVTFGISGMGGDDPGWPAKLQSLLTASPAERAEFIRQIRVSTGQTGAPRFNPGHTEALREALLRAWPDVRSTLGEWSPYSQGALDTIEVARAMGHPISENPPPEATPRQVREALTRADLEAQANVVVDGEALADRPDLQHARYANVYQAALETAIPQLRADPPPRLRAWMNEMQEKGYRFTEKPQFLHDRTLWRFATINPEGQEQDILYPWPLTDPKE